ncbi:MAG: hypothetical protein A7315_10105 [Candidatus Altiarchaeales archaeon WOR_SM1_79]|nr:MAG: hypothetical protein A7315_10105 [Candidatus Altiarchaeales archaeon WOR_SM1_79]
MNRNKILIILSALVLLIAIWVWQNPPGKFGLHSFGFTVYSSMPFPYFDLKIHDDGSFSIREKSHFVSLDEVKELADEKPDVLIIGIGYDEMVRVDERILNSFAGVEVLETSRAIERFNELKDNGRRVSAIIHSTC